MILYQYFSKAKHITDIAHRQIYHWKMKSYYKPYFHINCPNKNKTFIDVKIPDHDQLFSMPERRKANQQGVQYNLKSFD